MSTGKLPNQVLEKMLKDHIHSHRKEVLIGAGIGLDTAKVDLGGNVAVLSTDPITGAAEGIGRLAVNVSVNDVVCSSADPVGILLTILAPKDSTYADIEKVIGDAADAAKELNLEIIGGHTEITDAVNQMVVSTTVLGSIEKERIQDISKIQEGDLLYITKSAGLEGTAILCNDRADYLKQYLTAEEIEQGKKLGNHVSVLKEGLLGHDLKIRYMHDATEGGILGACYEAYKGMNKGLLIEEEKIPINAITKKVCEAFQIDPLRLISSGSMLLLVEKNRAEEVEQAYGSANLPVTQIGEVLGNTIELLKKDGTKVPIEPPTLDMLYLALGREGRA